jgi:hypothetical protein
VKSAKTAKELEQNIRDVFVDIFLGFGFKITSGRFTTTPDDSAVGPKQRVKVDRDETTIRDEIGEDPESETEIDPDVPTLLPEPIPEFIDQVNKYLFIESIVTTACPGDTAEHLVTDLVTYYTVDSDYAPAAIMMAA